MDEKSVPMSDLLRSVACVADGSPTNKELYPYSVKELVGEETWRCKDSQRCGLRQPCRGSLPEKGSRGEREPLSRPTIVEEKSAGGSGRSTSDFLTLAT